MDVVIKVGKVRAPNAVFSKAAPDPAPQSSFKMLSYFSFSVCNSELYRAAKYSTLFHHDHSQHLYF
jgi:hypothetical protein